MIRATLLLALTLVLLAAPATAQIPDTFENLQVFPKDISRGELIREMRHMAGALGLRCNGCHVGEDPDSLRGYDFKSDEKPLKKTARVMLQMVNTINGDLLPRVGKEKAELLQVRCWTCHHGQQRPQTLAEVLEETLAASGVEAAIAKYRQLREEKYGRGAFDLGEWSLLNFAESLAKSERLPEAERFLQLNMELYPDFGMNYVFLGQVHAERGEKDAALASFKKAIELDPERAEWIQRSIDRLNAPPPEE